MKKTALFPRACARIVDAILLVRFYRQLGRPDPLPRLVAPDARPIQQRVARNARAAA